MENLTNRLQKHRYTISAVLRRQKSKEKLRLRPNLAKIWLVKEKEYKDTTILVI